MSRRLWWTDDCSHWLPKVAADPERNFENFLLEGRSIRADVHEWLAARLPKNSRQS